MLRQSELYAHKHVDIFSLDVEGAEFEVLKTIDFKETQFGVIFHEADGSNPMQQHAIKSMLEDNGYAFWKSAVRINFYINRLWHKIYDISLSIDRADPDWPLRTQELP